LNEPKQIHRVSPEATRNRRVAHEALSDEATPGGRAHASDADSVGVARSEAKSAEPSEAHKARARTGNRDVVKSGSTPDFTTRLQTTRLLNVGYGNLVAAARVVAIVAPNASPMRRLRHEAAERGKLIDATEGRRTRSIVIVDSDHVVLSAINPETLAARLVEDDAEPRS
jgi:extracellular matrix regulatory protein A